MSAGGAIAENVPAPRVHSEGRNAHCPLPQSRKVVLCEPIRLRDLRDEERIIRAVVCSQNVANESRIVAVDIRSDGVDRRRKRAPQAYPALHGSATWILNTGDG